jgi:hypothetical protein
LNSSRILLLNIASSCTTCFFVEVYGYGFMEKVCSLAEGESQGIYPSNSPSYYNPCSLGLSDRFWWEEPRQVDCSDASVLCGCNQCCVGCSKLHVMQTRVGQLLQQGWNIASIICRMQLSRPHFSQYGQITGRVRSLECLYHSPQTVSSQRNGRHKPQHNPTCHGAARFSFLLPPS